MGRVLMEIQHNMEIKDNNIDLQSYCMSLEKELQNIPNEHLGREIYTRGQVLLDSLRPLNIPFEIYGYADEPEKQTLKNRELLCECVAKVFYVSSALLAQLLHRDTFLTSVITSRQRLSRGSLHPMSGRDLDVEFTFCKTEDTATQEHVEHTMGHFDTHQCVKMGWHSKVVFTNWMTSLVKWGRIHTSSFMNPLPSWEYAIITNACCLFFCMYGKDCLQQNPLLSLSWKYTNQTGEKWDGHFRDVLHKEKKGHKL